jgi:HEAT repeat protein
LESSAYPLGDNPLATIENKQPEPTGSAPIDEEWQGAQKVLTSLQLARKNFSLYPEDHVNCERALEQFWLQLDRYLQAHGNRRLELEKDRLLFQGEVILSEPPEEGNLPFTLFRDGIQWLEFQGGIDSDEVEEFLRILNKYRILADEPEGDLVTALWEARFPHIQYHVADFFWGAEPDIKLTASPKTTDGDSESLEEDEEEVKGSECFPPIDPAALEFTPEEEAELQKMVRFEEKRDPITEYLDALLDSLLEHRENENFVAIFETLEEEFCDSLARKDFDFTLKLLKSLHYVRKTCAAETTWAVPIIDNFFLTASSSQTLRPLLAAWSDMDTEQIAQAKQILLLLQPEAIHTLGAMLLQTSSFRLQQMLTEVILSLASRDLQPLEAMLGRPEEELVQKLVYVLGRLDGERPTQILRRMVSHASAGVRDEAVKALLSRGPANIKGLFHLIEDDSDSIRRRILHQMAQDRNKVTEALLLEYLEQGKLKRTNDEHIIACFRTLGRCGSPRSIQFLRKTLVGRGWLPSFRKSAYRQGAAIALQLMGVQGAQQVLEDASRSIYPSVRRIARKVIQGQRQPKEV